jgi:hypothetical protein
MVLAIVARSGSVNSMPASFSACSKVSASIPGAPGAGEVSGGWPAQRGE